MNRQVITIKRSIYVFLWKKRKYFDDITNHYGPQVFSSVAVLCIKYVTTSIGLKKVCLRS